MRSFIRWGVACLAALLFGQSYAATVSGVVYVEGPAAPVAPIAGATVNLFESGSVIASTLSDSAGGFQFLNVPAGTYTLEFTKAFYVKTTVASFDLTFDGSAIVPVSLTPSLQFAANGGSGGTKTWKITNKHAFNVTFTWDVIGTSQVGSGVAPPGVSYITTYAVQNGPDQLRLLVNGILIGAKGGAQTDPTPTTGTLAGRVSDQDGSPVQGASIQVLDAGGALAFSALSGVDGSYALGSVAAGVYSVMFSKAGYNSASYTNVGVTANSTTVRNATLVRQVAEVWVAAQNAADGSTLYAGNVTLTYDDGTTTTAKIGTDGNVPFFEQPVGVPVTISVDEGTGTGSTTLGGGFGPGVNNVLVTVTYPDSGNFVKVEVFDSVGAPMTDAIVTFYYGPGLGEVRTVNTGATNVAELHGLLYHNDQVNVEVRHPYVLRSGSYSVLLQPGENLVNARLTNYLTDTTVTVYEDDGVTPAAGAQVTHAGSGLIKVTDSNGVCVFTGISTNAKTALFDASTEDASGSTRLSNFGWKSTATIVLEPFVVGTTVDLTVYDSSHSLAAGATVMLSATDGSFSTLTQTGALGDAHFEGVPIGVPMNISVLSADGTERAQKQATFADGGYSDSITMDRPAQLNVYVYDSLGNQMWGTTSRLYSSDGAWAYDQPGAHLVEGYIFFQDIPPASSLTLVIVSADGTQTLTHGPFSLSQGSNTLYLTFDPVPALLALARW